MTQGAITAHNIHPGLNQNPSAPVIFCSRASHAALAEGIITITLERLSPDSSASDSMFHRYIAGQVVMSLEAFAEMVKQGNDLLNRTRMMMIAAAAQPEGPAS